MALATVPIRLLHIAGWSLPDLGRRVGRTPRYLSRVIVGHYPLTAELDAAIGEVLGDAWPPIRDSVRR